MEENPTHLVSTNTQGNLHAGPSSTINSIRNAQTLPTASPNLNPALVHPIRTYFAGERLLMDEDSEHEFKATHMTPKPVQKIIDLSYTYVNAFLNTSGGTLYCGVTDEGHVVGNLLTRDQRDHIRKSFDSLVLDAFWPCLDSRLATIQMVKVLPPPALIQAFLAPETEPSQSPSQSQHSQPQIHHPHFDSSHDSESEPSGSSSSSPTISRSAQNKKKKNKPSSRLKDLELERVPEDLLSVLGPNGKAGRTEGVVKHYLRGLLGCAT